MTTDASRHGQGARWQDQAVAWEWSSTERTLHVNHLELKATKNDDLKALERSLQGHFVTVSSDKMTTVTYINRQGGTHSPSLCPTVSNLPLWAKAKDISIRVSHVAGDDMQKPCPGDQQPQRMVAIPEHMQQPLPSVEEALHPFMPTDHILHKNCSRQSSRSRCAVVQLGWPGSTPSLHCASYTKSPSRYDHERAGWYSQLYSGP